MSDIATIQDTILKGRRVNISWLPAPFMPPREQMTQAYGVCFTEMRKIVLVSGDGQRWNLPGGRPEAGETLEETLAREVWEEACTRVVRSQYLGCQRVDDPEHPDGLQVYYQARFWARVEVYPFKPLFETTERKLVDTDAFFATLSWGSAPVARQIYEQALVVEDRNGSGCF